MLAAAAAVEAARHELTRLDAVAGDGDHGVTMTLAARALRDKLDAAPKATDADLLLLGAQAFASVGGAIGPLYAAALLRMAAVARERGNASSSAPAADLAALADAAETAITALGGAQPGDKTMLDALHPAVEALRAAARAGTDPGDALSEAARAARAGADSTADLVATVGRASRLGERSRGTPDAGATSLALILEAAATAYLATAAEATPR
jgi:dihydroxyacetone kinase phosphoprotein-dependent L subunit